VVHHLKSLGAPVLDGYLPTLQKKTSPPASGEKNYNENGGDTFLQNVGNHLQGNMASTQKMTLSSQP
jgi:hypothetical protein